MEKNKKKIIPYKEYPYIVYARVSSDKDGQRDSIPNQIDICRYWIEKNNFEWNSEAVFIDNDISGTKFLERKAMQSILRKARLQRIKMVVFKSIHRLARDLKDSLEIKEVIVGNNARVVTIEEGYDSLYEGKNDMKFEMHSLFASQYPKTLSLSISAALSAKVRRGEHIGTIPYGYEKVDGKLQIKEDEAKVVRKIFNLYNNYDYGYVRIVRALNDSLEKGEISAPPRSKYWSRSTVRSIVKNRVYTGTFTHNKYDYVKLEGRTKRIVNPKEKWNIYKNHHPKIITEAEWEKANNQSMIRDKTRTSFKNELSGLLECGECGSGMTINSNRSTYKDRVYRYRYVKCSRFIASARTECINHDPIRYEELRSFLIEVLSEEAKDVKLNLTSNYQSAINRKIERFTKQIKDINEKNKGLVNLLLEEVIDRDEFEENRMRYMDEKQELEKRINELENNKLNAIKIDNIREAFKHIIRKDKSLEHAFKTIISKITIKKNGETFITYNY